MPSLRDPISGQGHTIERGRLNPRKGAILKANERVDLVEVNGARLKAHEQGTLAGRQATVIPPFTSIEQHAPHLPVMKGTRLG